MASALTFTVEIQRCPYGLAIAAIVAVPPPQPAMEATRLVPGVNHRRRGALRRRNGGIESLLTQVWERLFIGGLADAEALAGSNPLGISTVITVCREAVRDKAEGVNYLHFPVPESRPLPVGRFDAIIDALWENIRWGKVLIHSLAGTNRAPVLAAAWMHAVGCKGIDAALADIGRLRTVEPSPILLRSVKRALR